MNAKRQEPTRGPSVDLRGLADRLHSAAIHLLRRLRVEDASSGLSGPRLSALSVIVFAGPISIGDLARAEQVSAPTISRMVKDLKAQGLVTREPTAGDGRVRSVRATSAGRALLEEGRERRVSALRSDLAALSKPELEVLNRAAGVLERLTLPAGHPGSEV